MNDSEMKARVIAMWNHKEYQPQEQATQFPLSDLPLEILILILKKSKVEDFQSLLNFARSSKPFLDLIFSTPELWTIVDLELEYHHRDLLKDYHVEALLSRCSWATLNHIKIVDLYGNSTITHTTIYQILFHCPSIQEIDMRHCYRVDIVFLENAIRSLFPPKGKTMKLIKIAHSGQAGHYYWYVFVTYN